MAVASESLSQKAHDLKVWALGFKAEVLGLLGLSKKSEKRTKLFFNNPFQHGRLDGGMIGSLYRGLAFAPFPLEQVLGRAS